MNEQDFLPHDRRNFVHKRIARGFTSFVSSGFNPVAGLGGFFAPEVRPPPVRRPPSRSSVARPSAASSAQKELGRSVKMTRTDLSQTSGRPTSGGCARGELKIGGLCFDALGTGSPGFGVRPAAPPRLQPPPPPQFMGPVQAQAGGAAVMGRYGAALQPGSKIIDRAVCLRGMVLGNDGLCYNRTQIKNSEREWPRGRRPLLTGGDMRAISIASRAASRLTRTAVRLHEIGLIKKPIAKKPPKRKC